MLWCDGVHQELSRRPVACPTAQATSGAQPRWRCRSSVQPLQLRCHQLIGPPASGKTTLAKALAPLLTAPGEPPALVLSTDTIRAEVFGDAAVQGPWIGASTRPGPQTHWQLHGYSRLFDLERQPEIRAGQKLRSLLHFVGKLIALGRGTVIARELWISTDQGPIQACGGWRQVGVRGFSHPMAHGLPTAQDMVTASTHGSALDSETTQDPSQGPAQHPFHDPAATPAIALTIGGSDSGGGAGIQADLKTFMALKVHGCSALSCVTAQNTRGVSRVDALPPEALTAQIEAVLSDMPVAALKTGMLLNRGLIEATSRALAPLAIPKLIDPVMVSRAGAVLLEPEAIQAYRDLLLPLAELITPNIQEARLLSGLPIASAADVERAAAVLRAQGVAAVLVKGGGLPELRGRDYLLAGVEPGRWLVGAVIDTPHTHGSGCTLGAAITAHRARGLEVAEAVVAAKTYVEGGLCHALAIGGGQGPLCHWHPLLWSTALDHGAEPLS